MIFLSNKSYQIKNIYHPLRFLKEENKANDFRDLIYNVDSNLNLATLKTESNNLLFLFQEIFKNHKIHFSPRNTKKNKIKVDFLLAEVLFLERYVSSSRTILFNRSEQNNKVILTKYYKIIDKLEKKWGKTLSSYDRWYNEIIDIKFIEIKGKNEKHKKDVKEIEFVESEFERSIGKSNDYNIDINEFILEYASKLKFEFLDDFNYSYILFCPIALASGNIDDLVKIGAVFLHFSTNKKINNNKQENLFWELYQGINVLANNSFSSEAVNKRDDEILLQSRKSAMSAIMSRNMSHNIGSHVIPGLKNYVNYNNEEFTKLLEYIGITKSDITKFNSQEKNILPELLKNKIGFIKDNLEKVTLINSINKHTQERMEFIADINMAKVFMHNALNFSQVIDNFRKNKKFIEFLAGGVKIKLSGFSKISSILFNDIQLSFPNDIMGVHAFYIILENFIRNTVKHSNLKSYTSIVKKTTEYSVNISLVVSESNSENGIEEFFCIDMVDNLGKENTGSRKKILKETIQNKLNEDIIDKSKNSIKSGGWGLLEMRIAAGYLVNEIDNFNNSLSNTSVPIISVHYYNNKNEISETGFNLGYRFYIHKPQLAIVIHKDDFIISKNRTLFLENIGIKLIRKKGINRDLFLGSNHDFLIVPEGIKLAYINQRKLFFTNEEFNHFETILVNKNLNGIKKFLWDKWIVKNQYNLINIAYDIFNKNDNLNQTAFFDNHGSEFKDKTYQEIKKTGLFYYEPFGSQSFTSKVINKDKGKYNNFSVEEELLESIHTKVAIIDERIQKAASYPDNNLPNLTVREVLSLMRIEVPALGQNKNSLFVLSLDRFIFETEKYQDKLEKYIISLLQDSETRFIIIHLTIFEKLCKNKNKEGIQEKLNYFKKKIKSKIEKSIVLISGRGTPSNLPKNCYYMHFSIIQNYVIYNRSKYSLIKALYSARKNK